MRDLRDFYSPHMTATINGHKFTVEAPSAKEGLRIQMIMADPEKAAKVNTTEELNKLFKGTIDDEGVPSGGLWDELDEKGVSLPEALHLGNSAMLYYGLNEAAAVAYWESAAEDEDEAPKAPKRAPRKKTT